MEKPKRRKLSWGDDSPRRERRELSPDRGAPYWVGGHTRGFCGINLGAGVLGTDLGSRSRLLGPEILRISACVPDPKNVENLVIDPVDDSVMAADDVPVPAYWLQITDNNPHLRVKLQVLDGTENGSGEPPGGAGVLPFQIFVGRFEIQGGQARPPNRLTLHPPTASACR